MTSVPERLDQYILEWVTVISAVHLVLQHIPRILLVGQDNQGGAWHIPNTLMPMTMASQGLVLTCSHASLFGFPTLLVMQALRLKRKVSCSPLHISDLKPPYDLLYACFSSVPPGLPWASW